MQARYRPIGIMRTAKIGLIATSGLMVVLGAVMLLFPKESIKTFSLVIGWLLLVYGAVKIIGYFSKDLYRLAFEYDLAYGLLIIALAAVIVFKPTYAISVINIIIGIVVLTDGLFKIQISLDAKGFGLLKWWLIFILAIPASVIGLLLILKSWESGVLLTRFIGLSLVFDGILGLAVAHYGIKIIRHQHFEAPNEKAYITDRKD